MCLSAPINTCTDAAQCDIVEIYDGSDNSFTNNLLINLGPLAQGDTANRQTNGTPIQVDN